MRAPQHQLNAAQIRKDRRTDAALSMSRLGALCLAAAIAGILLSMTVETLGALDHLLAEASARAAM